MVKRYNGNAFTLERIGPMLFSTIDDFTNTSLCDFIFRTGAPIGSSGKLTKEEYERMADVIRVSMFLRYTSYVDL